MLKLQLFEISQPRVAGLLPESKILLSPTNIQNNDPERFPNITNVNDFYATSRLRKKNIFRDSQKDVQPNHKSTVPQRIIPKSPVVRTYKRKSSTYECVINSEIDPCLTVM